MDSDRPRRKEVRYEQVALADIRAPGPNAIVGGPFGSKLTRSDYVDAGVPVIRGQNLPPERRFSEDAFVFVTPAKVSSDLAGNVAFPGDVIVTQRGTLGQVGLIPTSASFSRFVISQSQMKISVDKAKANGAYVYYALKSPLGQHEILDRAISSGVPHINLELFRAIPIPLPPLQTQRKIAGVLSAYDDLIENNNRRIQILEEIAQRIYREWFVHFRYPGHEDVPMVESEIGPIPEGWEVREIRDVAEVTRGRSYKSSEIGDPTGQPFVTLKCVQRDGGFRRDGLKQYSGPSNEDQTVRPGDVVVAVTDMTQERRIVGRAARVPPYACEGGVISMDLVRVRASRVPALLLYGQLRYSPAPRALKEFASGTNVLHLHPDRIANYEIAVPPIKLALSYAELASPMQALSDALANSNLHLEAARDLLLPRLVSGELDVSDLDIQMSEAA